jgi:protocatechuate 3,4-dioxygenase beta subunit
MTVSRRTFLSGVTGMAFMSATQSINALTPRQSLGPFYPTKRPLDSDADLTFVSGRDGVAAGEITNLFGRVTNTEGASIADALVEIWQCDAFGAYHHPRAGGGIDPHFQGFGKTRTDAQGRYRFRTIKPVVYPGRAPHIHIKITTASTELVTQIYVQGESTNDGDFLLNAINDETARRSLIIPFAPDNEGGSSELMAVFNPVLRA